MNLKHFEWAKVRIAQVRAVCALLISMNVLQDRIVMGAERKSAFISDHVKKMTAYHEVRWSLITFSHFVHS